MNPEVEQAVADLEKLIGTTLPDDYRTSLLGYGGDDLVGKKFWVPHPSGRWIDEVGQGLWIDILLEEIMPIEIELGKDDLGSYPRGLLPIADNGCGDTILLSYREADRGAVYYFFHEEATWDDRNAGLHLLAPTFTAWLEQLEDFVDE